MPVEFTSCSVLIWWTFKCVSFSFEVAEENMHLQFGTLQQWHLCNLAHCFVSSVQLKSLHILLSGRWCRELGTQTAGCIRTMIWSISIYYSTSFNDSISVTTSRHMVDPNHGLDRSRSFGRGTRSIPTVGYTRCCPILSLSSFLSPPQIVGEQQIWLDEAEYLFAASARFLNCFSQKQNVSLGFKIPKWLAAVSRAHLHEPVVSWCLQRHR